MDLFGAAELAAAFPEEASVVVQHAHVARSRFQRPLQHLLLQGHNTKNQAPDSSAYNLHPEPSRVTAFITCNHPRLSYRPYAHVDQVQKTCIHNLFLEWLE